MSKNKLFYIALALSSVILFAIFYGYVKITSKKDVSCLTNPANEKIVSIIATPTYQNLLKNLGLDSEQMCNYVKNLQQSEQQNQTQNNPPTGPVSQTDNLVQLLSSNEESKTFLIELQRSNPKLDINKATLVYSEPITSIRRSAILPDYGDLKWTFSPNGKNAFYDSGCFKEGDRETLDVVMANGKSEIRTILDWGTACPRGNGFWLSDTKLAYLHTYSYTQEEPESANVAPASTYAVETFILDLAMDVENIYYVKSLDVIKWPTLSYEERRRNLAICEERHGIGDFSCLGYSQSSQLGIGIASDGKSIYDYNGKILLTMKDMLLSDKFISFAKANNFRLYNNPANSSFLKIAPLSQSAYMISSCLNCNTDLYSYEASFIFNTTDGVLRYFYGKGSRFSDDRNLVMLRIGGDAEVTAWGENIYEVSTGKLMGNLSTRGSISDFAKATFNITSDTFVTFEFSSDSRYIIITPQVYDGSDYKSFSSKLRADLDGKNLSRY